MGNPFMKSLALQAIDNNGSIPKLNVFWDTRNRDRTFEVGEQAVLLVGQRTREELIFLVSDDVPDSN